MVDRKKSDFRFPVALVKERKPDGHSGHRRLQDVVGSKEIATGKNEFTAFLKILEII